MIDRRTLLLTAPLLVIVAVAGAQAIGKWIPDRESRGVRLSLPPEVAHALECRDARDGADKAGAAALQRDQAALVARLEGADPVRDAQQAAARGDFRLIRAETMMGLFAIGVECRTATDNRWTRAPLTLATRFYSDVPGSCETGGGPDPCRTEKLLDGYAPAYNRTLVSSPNYPYADLCRALPQSLPAGMPFRAGDPSEYGFPDLAPTDRPHDLHEAARRGTPAALARMIGAVRGEQVDRPDPYGLTPLAWAVIRRRPDAARQLLAAGASPIGRGCAEPDAPESPLRLALFTGQEKLARAMLTPEVKRRVTPWPGRLVQAAAHGGAASLLEQMLREPRTGPFAGGLIPPSGGDLPASSRRVLDGYVEGLCWQAKLPAGTIGRMVGVYESDGVTRGFQEHKRGPVEIRLARSSRPLLLVVSSYEAVEWRIRRAPGDRLVGILATGYYRPTVTGALGGVPVLINDLDNRCTTLGGQFYAYKAGAEQESFVQAVSQMTGVEVADFQGRYAAHLFELR